MATSGSVFVGIGEGTSGLTLAWVKVARSETEIRDRERCGGIGFSVPRLSEIEGCFRFYKPTLIVAPLELGNLLRQPFNLDMSVDAHPSRSRFR